MTWVYKFSERVFREFVPNREITYMFRRLFSKNLILKITRRDTPEIFTLKLTWNLFPKWPASRSRNTSFIYRDTKGKPSCKLFLQQKKILNIRGRFNITLFIMTGILQKWLDETVFNRSSCTAGRWCLNSFVTVSYVSLNIIRKMFYIINKYM